MPSHRNRHIDSFSAVDPSINRLIDYYGVPNSIRLDNGSELVSQMFTEWAAAKSIAIRYIQPSKPNQNAFIERFNRTYRIEVLDAYLIANLELVQTITDQWLIDYNKYRPRMKHWATSRRCSSCPG